MTAPRPETLEKPLPRCACLRNGLNYWLVENPIDTAGVPFCVRTGSRKKFEPRDIERIIAHLRELEAARLGPSVKNKVRLVGLMAQVGGVTYEDLLRRREEEKRKKAEERAQRVVQRRVRLPRYKGSEDP
jgi:hypothetical protein